MSKPSHALTLTLSPVVIFAFLSCLGWILDTDTRESSGMVALQGQRSPIIGRVIPDHGSKGGGKIVTILGRNFTKIGMTSVLFGGAHSPQINVISESVICCITPPHKPGPVEVIVKNHQGASALREGYHFDSSSILWLKYTKGSNGSTCDLTWELTDPADEIKIYRGVNELDTIDGGAESYTLEETGYGLFRYTVALVEEQEIVDQKDLLVDFGKVLWDPPEGDVTGYYIYLAEAIGDPYEVLPYEDPSNYSFDAGFYTEALLETLYSVALIEGDKSYYIAASSYLVVGSETLISALTDPLTFAYEVATGKP